MAGILEKLEFWIGADGSAAVREFKHVGDEAERGLGRTQSATDKWSRNFMVAGAAMVGTGIAVGKTMWDLGMGASSLGETINQTNVIFGKSADAVGEFAEGAAAIGQSEVAAREAANTFGLFFRNAGLSAEASAEMSIEMVQLASDMASFKDTSPEQAVHALGAALRGETEPLRYYGITLNQDTILQKAMADGLVTSRDEMDQNIKMQASYNLILEQSMLMKDDFRETYGESMPNQLRTMRAEMENLRNGIGEAFIPTMSFMVQKTSGVIGAINDWDEAHGRIVGKLGTFGAVALTFLGSLTFITGALMRVKDGFHLLQDGYRKFHDWIKAAPENIGKAITAFRNMVTSIGLLQGAVMGVVAAGVGAALYLWFNSIQEEADRAARATQRFKDALNGTNPELEIMTAIVDTLAETEFDDILKDTDANFRLLGDAVRTSGDELDRWADMLGGPGSRSNNRRDFMNDLREMAAGGDALANELLRLQREQGLTDYELGVLVESMDKANDSMDAATRETETYTHMQEDMAPAVEETSQAQQNAASSTKDAAEAYDEATDAAREYFDTVSQSLDDEMAWYEAWDSLTEAVKENGTTLDVTTEQGRNNRQSLMDLAEAGVQAAMTYRDQTKDLDGAKAMLYANRDALIAHAIELGLDEEAVKDLQWRMGLTDEQIETQFLQPGLQEGVNGLNEMKGLMEWIIAHPRIQVDAGVWIDSKGAEDLARLTMLAQSGQYKGGVRGGGIAPVGAVGRPVSPWTTPWMLVGESGPEVFAPTERGRIENTQSRRSTSARGGGSLAVNVYAATNADPYTIADEVAWAIRTSGR